MTTYLFCVGGTGARVLRSLTMLLASGAKIGAGDTIVPIVIDYDITNGDLSITKSLIGRYTKLHEYAAYTKDEEGFFKVPIELRDFSFVDVKQQTGKETFKQYIDFDAIRKVSPETALLMESLYDESPKDDPRTELNLEMSRGFKGNPNIGSVVFNEYFTDPKFGYRDFLSNFSNGDRIFIVGSIFGGTGSSGLPSLVKKFRQTDSTAGVGNSPALRCAPVGACVVLPYFEVAQDDKSAINSMTFVSKTKAALTYYTTEMNDLLNEIYYIACDKTNVAYPNFEGGERQKNKAHIVELLSAMSVLEFINKETKDIKIPSAEAPFKPKFFEYFTKTGIAVKDDRAQISDPSYLDLLDIPSDKPNSIYGKYAKYMTMFSYFAKYCLDNVQTGAEKGMSYYKGDAGLENYIKDSTPFGTELYAFASLYKEWIKEFKANSLMEFYPYDFSHDLTMLVNVKDEKTKVHFMENTIRTAMNKAFVNLGKSDYNNKEGEFLRMGYKAGGAAAAKLYK